MFPGDVSTRDAPVMYLWLYLSISSSALDIKNWEKFSEGEYETSKADEATVYLNESRSSCNKIMRVYETLLDLCCEFFRLFQCVYNIY